MPVAGLPRPGGRAAPGLGLFGVVSLAAPGALALDGAAARTSARLRTPPLGTPAAEVVRVRDLGAVVAARRFAEEPLTAELLRAHRAVVEAVFADRAVLPAPPGAVFRTRVALEEWMELHAGALAEGLRFVEDRAEARVTAAGPTASALEAFAALRRDAAALLVLRAEGAGDGSAAPDPGPAAAGQGAAPAGAAPAGAAPGAAAPGAAAPGAAAPALEAHAALLVERGAWGAFGDAVAREARLRPELRMACAGPWPPYSFVRLDFGA